MILIMAIKATCLELSSSVQLGERKRPKKMVYILRNSPWKAYKELVDEARQQLRQVAEKLYPTEIVECSKVKVKLHFTF